MPLSHVSESSIAATTRVSMLCSTWDTAPAMGLAYSSRPCGPFAASSRSPPPPGSAPPRTPPPPRNRPPVEP
eukprot:4678895-Pleurochrysis_carterae.AAC.1